MRHLDEPKKSLSNVLLLEEYGSRVPNRDVDGGSSQPNACDKGFNHKNSQNDQTTTQTTKKRFPCTECSMSLSSKSNLGRHMILHSGNYPSICQICNKGCIDLEKHMRVHTGEKPFTCKICDKCFSRRSHLNAHARVHQEEKLHSCPFCNKRFKYRTNCKKHMRMHSKSELISHPIRDEVCVVGDSLPKYVTILTDDESITCFAPDENINGESSSSLSICLGNNDHPGNAQEPNSRHRSNESANLFTCRICGKKLMNKQILKRHMKNVHLLSRSLPCSMCNKVFKDKGSLKRHEKTHSCKKPHSCPICNKGYCRKYLVAKHMKIHKNPSGLIYIGENSVNMHSDVPQGVPQQVDQDQQQPNGHIQDFEETTAAGKV
ncbi:hypothetical protein QAD02_019547 [Eretmocerus hayati]|uniref:Uncharacterized protein n=1 Tax=Eretmocerus hayati TaxID=131215 RepID=A0ACC2PJJ1_9HYME|nr:hypothetical protein QAD02_019547 [Eretmocerus hayati]